LKLIVNGLYTLKHLHRAAALFRQRKFAFQSRFSHQEISFLPPSVPLSPSFFPGRVFLGMSARPEHRDRAGPEAGTKLEAGE
jgi:hypothetical protein